MEVRRQAEEDRQRYAELVPMREPEIERLHRVRQQMDQNPLASKKVARVAKEELVREHALNATIMRRATSPAQLERPRLLLNTSPRMEVDLRPPCNPVGKGPGYDREEDLMREELERGGCTPGSIDVM